MMPHVPPTWQRFFAEAAASAPTQPLPAPPPVPASLPDTFFQGQRKPPVPDPAPLAARDGGATHSAGFPPEGAPPMRAAPPIRVAQRRQPAYPWMENAPTWGRATHPFGWYGSSRDGGAASAGAAPPDRPRPPVDQRPTPSEQPRRALELAWLTWQLPEPLREAVLLTLRQTLERRAQQCRPLGAPKKPPEYTRFGLLGERLAPKGVFTMRKILRAELREVVRMMEGQQSRTERNRRLAMHGVRLSQLCAELEQRGIDALKEASTGLAKLGA